MDALLFYRMGDFYELFLDDAVTAAEILNITLTARHKDLENPVPMCGVPFHSATSYINKLLASSCRVAICEQTSDPSQSKGIVKREIVRIVSPGMAYDLDAIAADDSTYLLSIYSENFAQLDQKSLENISGAATFLELSTGEIYYTRFASLSELLTVCSAMRPNELLAHEHFIANPLFGSLQDMLFNLLQDEQQNACISPLPKHYYNGAQAWEELCHHYNVKDLAAFAIEPESEVLFSLGAAFLRIRNTQFNANLAHLRKPVEYNPNSYLQLDESTIDHLDLLPKPDRNENESLFYHLNHTKTALGARLLKQLLVRPLVNINDIEERQSAVESLTKTPAHMDSLRDKLKGVRDLERLCGKIGTKSASPKDLLSLKETLSCLPYIRAALAQFKDSSLLVKLHGEIEEFKSLTATLVDRIAEEAPPHAREGNIFKSGWNAELDELIELNSNGRQKILEMEASEREASGIQNLKIKYNRVFGYFIEVTKKNASSVPKHYVRKQTMVNAERYITDKLKIFEDKVLRAEEKRIRLESNLYEDLLKEVSTKSQELLLCASHVALVDALQSLAHIAFENGYTKPTLTNDLDLEIEDGRHPVLERLLGSDVYISNSVKFSAKEKIWLITGPNMAGKSTFMRQTALLSLMAHIGSFLPAKRAQIGLIDRIASRVGASDRIGRGQSTFMVEMSEIARILNVATARSLLIIDEIGRGTSTFDGLAIAWSIIEKIHDKLESRTLFATHYHELTDLAQSMCNMHNLHVGVGEENGKIVFLHSILPGKASGSYGVEVARLAGVPSDVLERANAILRRLDCSIRERSHLLGQLLENH